MTVNCNILFGFPLVEHLSDFAVSLASIHTLTPLSLSFTHRVHVCLQELRKGKYNKVNSNAADVLHTISELGIPVESTANMSGVVLLPPETVEQLLQDRRRLDIVQPFKLALLKLASQVGHVMPASNVFTGLHPALQLWPLRHTHIVTCSRGSHKKRKQDL